MHGTRSLLFKHRGPRDARPPQDATVGRRPTTGSAPEPVTSLTPAELHALWRSTPLERRHL